MLQRFFIAIVLLLPTSFIAQTLDANVSNFIKLNAKKCAFYVVKNNKLLLSHQADATVPIATLSDLLVAIEFAKQSTYKVINADEEVSLKDIVTFHFENKYQPEYEDWLTSLLVSKKIQDQNTSVSLQEITHGMLQYGSQPNTEYLIEKIGFDNIKSSIVSYNLTGHSTIAYPVGSLALFQNRKGTSEKKMYKAINDLEDDAYSASSYVMHSALKADTTFKVKMPVGFPNDKALKAWSNKLPQGTVKSYGNLFVSLLKEKMLDAKFYRKLRTILEWKMTEPNIAATYDRYMEKTSSTINTFTQAKFVKTKSGDETVIIYTFYDQTEAQIKEIKKMYTGLDAALENDASIGNTIKTLVTIKK